MSSEYRVDKYTKLAVKLVFVVIGIVFWCWMAGDDLDGASYVVIALLVMLSAELDLKVYHLQRSIDDLREQKSSAANEGLVETDGKRVGPAEAD